ncbi:MAG: hypothetical protein HY544_03820 [Candidatus Diapherotrites archaeon]|uniref:Uncharacterized protein n=1 Tax=Candidatus Iainarchaeum sp. TaxID=3101447 RepID=A0A8T3YKN4_9ARCH|nr:hypothetical protein [Candidatus Diapherotrites archaeon]
MNQFLPFPAKVPEIKSTVDQISQQKRQRFETWKGYNPEVMFAKKYKNGPIYKGDDFDDLTMHSLARANHQISEACNKIYGTSELLYTKEENAKFKEFSLKFTGGTVLPTLYYAQITAMISILSCFGIISIREGEKTYNLVRTGDRWQYLLRRTHLEHIAEGCPAGWHQQILYMYEKLQENGVELPKIDLQKTKELQALRNNYHYDILTQTAMQYDATEKYFEYLPTVMNTTQIAITTINKIWKITNKCDARYQELADKMKGYLVASRIAEQNTSQKEERQPRILYTKEELELIGIDYPDDIYADDD